MRYIYYLLICLLLATQACKPPRCTIPNCYVRMKHRHGGENWKAAEAPAEFNPDFDASASRGKEYRGVRWWKKNKNPKIGEGYKPGYKYDHKKPKYKKPKSKKSRPEDEQPTTGEEQLTDGQTQSEDSTAVAPEKKKGLFGKRRSKKAKKAEEEQQPVEETEEQVKPDKKADEKDGF